MGFESDTHVFPPSTWATPTMLQQYIWYPLLCLQTLDLDTVTTPASLATTLLHCLCLQTILWTPQLLCHNGKHHVQKNFSVPHRSWWDSDRIKTIVGQVHLCHLFSLAALNLTVNTHILLSCEICLPFWDIWHVPIFEVLVYSCIISFCPAWPRIWDVLPVWYWLAHKSQSLILDQGLDMFPLWPWLVLIHSIFLGCHKA